MQHVPAARLAVFLWLVGVLGCGPGLPLKVKQPPPLTPGKTSVRERKKQKWSWEAESSKVTPAVCPLESGSSWQGTDSFNFSLAVRSPRPFFFFFKCPWEQRKMFSVLSEGHSSPALSRCQKRALSDSCQISLCERTVRGEERAELRDTLLTPTRLFYHMFPTRGVLGMDGRSSFTSSWGVKKYMSNCEGVMPWWTGWGIFSFSMINSKNRFLCFPFYALTC